MKSTSENRGTIPTMLGLIVCLSALPLLLGVAGCTTGSHHEQSTSEQIEDRGTSTRVETALSEDSQYKYGTVRVETFKGIVELTGFVNSRDQKNRAADLARKVTGVRSVVNNITVKESAN